MNSAISQDTREIASPLTALKPKVRCTSCPGGNASAREVASGNPGTARQGRCDKRRIQNETLQFNPMRTLSLRRCHV